MQRAGLGLLIVASTLVGCYSTEGTASSSYTGLPEPGGQALSAAESIRTSGYTIEKFYQDYYGALEVVDNWWGAHWSEHLTGSYSPPDTIQGYYGAGLYNRNSGRPNDQIWHPNETQFTCHGQPIPPDNALYCHPTTTDPVDNFLAFDVEFLLEARELGDVFPYLIVAHEWGHAIASRLQTSLVPYWYELQADCLAEASLQGAARDRTLLWEQGDNQEVIDGLTYLGDAVEWGNVFTDPSTGEPVRATHGSPQQRIDWLLRGVQAGVDACLNFD